MIGQQAYQMQTVQQMPNGQLVMVQNPNVGINNPSYVVAQQPQYNTLLKLNFKPFELFSK